VLISAAEPVLLVQTPQMVVLLQVLPGAVGGQIGTI